LCIDCHLVSLTHLRNLYNSDLRILLCFMPNSLWLKDGKDVGYADLCLMSVVSLLNVLQ